MIHIVSYHTTRNSPIGFVVEERPDEILTEEAVFELVTTQLTRMFAEDVEELLEIQIVDNYDFNEVDTLNLIERTT